MPAGVAFSRDAGQERVKTEPSRFGNNRCLERAADSSAAKRGRDVERRFGRLVVRRTVRKAAQRGPAHNLAVNQGNDDWVASAVFLEPVLPLRDGLGLDVECRR